MTKKKATPPGNGDTNLLQDHDNKKSLPKPSSQKQIILAWLKANGSLDTLTARSELFIMSPASRIGELQAQGYNIINRWKIIGKVKIADYVLIAEKGATHE